jgi:hypothetical protein
MYIFKYKFRLFWVADFMQTKNGKKIGAKNDETPQSPSILIRRSDKS